MLQKTKIGFMVILGAAFFNFMLPACDNTLSEDSPAKEAPNSLNDADEKDKTDTTENDNTVENANATEDDNTAENTNTEDNNTGGNTNTTARASITSFSISKIPGLIDNESKTIKITVPYTEGINLKNTVASAVGVTVSDDVNEIKAKDGATVYPYNSGTLDLSKPKIFTATTEDGTKINYTVTVYVLFTGYDSLKDLNTYTSIEANGFTTKTAPIYIALAGFDFSQMLDGQNSRNNTSTKVETATYIFGCSYSNGYQINVNEPGFTNNQYLVLDLSQCTGSRLLGPYITSHDGKTPGPFAKVVSIILPEKIINLGDCLFEGGVIEDVKLPPYLIEVSYKTFANATSLKKIELPGSLKKIGIGAFENTALTSLELPNGLIGLGDAAFAGSKIAGTLTLPSSVSSLGVSVFSGTKISAADFSNLGITVLPISSFYGCASLEAVYLPASVYQIADSEYTFGGLASNKFKTLVVNSVIPPEISSVSFNLNQGDPVLSKYSSLTIYVPDGSIDDYKKNGFTSKNEIAQQWSGWAVYAGKIKGISALGEAAK